MSEEVTDFRRRRYGKRSEAKIQTSFRVTKEKRLQLERIATSTDKTLNEVFEDALDALEEKLNEPLMEVMSHCKDGPASTLKEGTVTKMLGHNTKRATISRYKGA